MKEISYLDTMLKDNRIIRWPDSAMPVKVHIMPFNWYEFPEEADIYENMMKNAFHEWSRATEGLLNFEFVDISNQAQIRVHWIRVCRKALGWCSWENKSNGELISARIEIGFSDGIIHGGHRGHSNIYHTMLHEVGHAIGLFKHTIPESDIMTKNTTYDRYNQLSPRDIISAKWLYRFPCGAYLEDVQNLYLTSSDYTFDKLIYKFEYKDGMLSETPSLDECYINFDIDHITSSIANLSGLTLRNTGKVAQINNLSLKQLGLNNYKKLY